MCVQKCIYILKQAYIYSCIGVQAVVRVRLRMPERKICSRAVVDTFAAAEASAVSFTSKPRPPPSLLTGAMLHEGRFRTSDTKLGVGGAVVIVVVVGVAVTEAALWNEQIHR